MTDRREDKKLSKSNLLAQKVKVLTTSAIIQTKQLRNPFHPKFSNFFGKHLQYRKRYAIMNLRLSDCQNLYLLAGLWQTK